MLIRSLTPVQVGYFRELFLAIDKENDGTVTFRELFGMTEALGTECTSLEVQEMLNAADLDGNGSLEFSEFVEVLAQKLMEEANIEEYREVFKFFDKENNGFITTAQLRPVYLALGIKLTDGDLDETLREADCDKDGTLQFEEFLRVMTTIEDKPQI